MNIGKKDEESYQTQVQNPRGVALPLGDLSAERASQIYTCYYYEHTKQETILVLNNFFFLKRKRLEMENGWRSSY